MYSFRPLKWIGAAWASILLAGLVTDTVWS